MAVSNIKPNLNIHIKPNQTLKDFSYGQKFVKGLASRSIAPVILLEAFVEAGRTYQAYQRGGFTEARERLTEEMTGALFWFSGVPLFNSLIDKFVGKKLFKLPETDFDTGKDAVRDPFRNYMNKFKNQLKIDPKKAEKVIAGYKFGKVMTSILLANALVGFVLPKANQAITKHIMKKQKAEETTKPKTNSQNQANQSEKNNTQPQYTMDKFMKQDKNVSFGAVSPQTLMSLAYSFENNPKYGLISTDAGVWVGRGVSARNNHERTEVLFRDISSSYFYMFNMPVVAFFLNKLQTGSGTRLDPIAAQQVTDLMQEVLKANDGKMSTDDFRTAMLGNRDNAAYITPKLQKAIREGNGTVELDKFTELLNDVKSKYPEIDIERFKKSAKGMSELQPKLSGKAIVTAKQIADIFTDGAVNIPDFLKNVFRCSTSDQNLFTGSISEPVFDKDLRFIHKETFIKKQQEIEHYIQSVIKKAKNGEITKELLEKARKENFGKNAFNWGIGFAISAAFLSTFIPKIQYWITRKATGSNAFPGTADYSNEKK